MPSTSRSVRVRLFDTEKSCTARFTERSVSGASLTPFSFSRLSSARLPVVFPNTMRLFCPTVPGCNASYVRGP